jgi:4'-phosphopantetheinyl transferase EntD
VDAVVERLRFLAPSTLVIESASGDASSSLFLEELEVTKDWAAHRRAQFALGRACARRALAQLDIAPCPILFDEHGAPSWPAGATGSISHKRQNCIVAVGHRSVFAGIGVDLEVDAPDPGESDVVRRVCVSAAEVEQSRVIGNVVSSPGTLFLSAKEAVFKLEFPLTAEWLDFDDVEVTFGGTNTFHARRVAELGAPAMRGVFATSPGWLATLAAR